jgi:hypothetical protein
VEVVGSFHVQGNNHSAIKRFAFCTRVVSFKNMAESNDKETQTSAAWGEKKFLFFLNHLSLQKQFYYVIKSP